MKNSKKVSIAVLILLSLLLTGFTWSYWVNSDNIAVNTVTGENTIVLGASKNKQNVVTEITLSDSNNTSPLVPTGRKGSSVDGAVESITQSMTLSWSLDSNSLASGAKGTYAVSLDDVKVDGISVGLNSLIKVQLSNTSKSITIGDQEIIEMVITMDEPASKQEYDAYAGKQVTLVFSTSFSVEQ